MTYCRHIPRAVILPWGCAIELDKLGLPASPRIYHEQATCLCAGRQDELLLKQLDHWRTHEAELLQVDPKCAAVTIIRLIDKWNLGTTGWLSGLQELKGDLVQKAIPNNPLAKAKIFKAKKRSPKLKSTGIHSTVELNLRMGGCEDEQYC